MNDLKLVKGATEAFLSPYNQSQWDPLDTCSHLFLWTGQCSYFPSLVHANRYPIKIRGFQLYLPMQKKVCIAHITQLSNCAYWMDHIMHDLPLWVIDDNNWKGLYKRWRLHVGVPWFSAWSTLLVTSGTPFFISSRKVGWIQPNISVSQSCLGWVSV